MKTCCLRRSLALFLFAILVSACEFEPDGEAFVEIAPPSGDGISISLNLIDNNDTIDLYTDAQLTFSILSGQKTVISASIFLNDEHQLTYRSNSGVYYIRSRQLGSGFHKMRIEVTTRSNSGSLADAAGLEEVSIWREWILNIDVTPPSPQEFIAIGNVDGTVSLEWDAYQRPNFEQYRVVKHCWINQTRNEPCRSYVITDPLQTSIADTTNIGARTSYSLIVTASGISTEGPQSTLEAFDRFQVNFVQTDDNQFSFEWTPPELSENFAYYEVRVNNQDRTIVTDINDTTFSYTEDLRFGGGGQLYVEAYPKGDNIRIQERIRTKVLFNEDLFIGFTDGLFINNVNNSYYAQRGPELQRIDQTSLDTVATQDFRVVSGEQYIREWKLPISPDRRHMYFVENKQIHRLNPNTLEVTESHTLGDLFDDPDIWFDVNGPGDMHISNDNILIAPTFAGILVLDMDTFTIMNNIDFAGFLRVTEISQNSEYLMIYNQLYKREGNTYVLVGNYQDEDETPSAAFFEDDAGSKIIWPNGQTVSIIETQNLIETANFPFAYTPTRLSYSSSLQLLGGYSINAPLQNTFFMIDPLTGEQSQLQFSAFGTDGRIYLYDEFIITYRGYIRRLD